MGVRHVPEQVPVRGSTFARNPNTYTSRTPPALIRAKSPSAPPPNSEPGNPKARWAGVGRGSPAPAAGTAWAAIVDLWDFRISTTFPVSPPRTSRSVGPGRKITSGSPKVRSRGLSLRTWASWWLGSSRCWRRWRTPLLRLGSVVMRWRRRCSRLRRTARRIWSRCGPWYRNPVQCSPVRWK